MLDWDILILWHYLMAIRNQVCDNCATIITARRQHLCPLSDGNRIATLLVLPHDIPTGAVCVLWGIFIVDVDFGVLGN